MSTLMKLQEQNQNIGKDAKVSGGQNGLGKTPVVKLCGHYSMADSKDIILDGSSDR